MQRKRILTGTARLGIIALVVVVFMLAGTIDGMKEPPEPPGHLTLAFPLEQARVEKFEPQALAENPPEEAAAVSPPPEKGAPPAPLEDKTPPSAPLSAEKTPPSEPLHPATPVAPMGQAALEPPETYRTPIPQAPKEAPKVTEKPAAMAQASVPTSPSQKAPEPKPSPPQGPALELPAPRPLPPIRPAPPAAVSQPPGIVPLKPPAPRERIDRPRLMAGFAGKYFQMEKPRLGVKFSYETEEEERTGRNIDTRDTTREFREGLTIETKGSVYHPALLKYTLRLEPEWRQVHQERDPGIDSKDNVFLPAYFADVTFLERKPYTLHLFGSREESTLRSAFAQLSDSDVDTYGADLRLTYKLLPTFMGYTHRTISQSGFFVSDEERDDYRLITRHHTARSNTRFSSVYSESLRTTRGIITEVQNANSDIRNDYNISGDGKILLNSFLSHRQTETNFFNSTDLRLTENLHWRHHPNLRSDYDLNFDRNTAGEFEMETKSGAARLTHLLYEDLTTTLAGDATFNDFTGGREDIFGARAHWDYRRKIPWGRLNLSAGYDYEITRRELDQNIIRIVNESHVLRLGEVTLLRNDNVDLGAIRVTDATGTILFFEGIDFRIETIGAFVRIVRIPFGTIEEGQEILVSYSFLANPAFDDTLFTQSYGVEFFLWNSLTLSYRFQHAAQDVVSGTPPEDLIDDTFQSSQIRYEWRWTDTRFLYEQSDRSSGISTTRWLASETLRFRPSRTFFLSLKGDYGKTRFEEREEIETLYALRSRLDWVPLEWCRFNMEGFRDTIESDFEKIVDTGISAGVKLTYRIWTGNILVGYLDERDEVSGERRSRQQVRVEVVRILW